MVRLLVGVISLSFSINGLSYNCSSLSEDTYHRTNKMKYFPKGQSNSEYINEVNMGGSLCGPTSLAHLFGGIAKNLPSSALNKSGPAYLTSRTSNWVPDLKNFSEGASYFAKKLKTNKTYELAFMDQKFFDIDVKGTWRIDLMVPTVKDGLNASFYSYGDSKISTGLSYKIWPQNVKTEDFSESICDSVKREGLSRSSGIEYDLHNTQHWVSYGHYKYKKKSVSLCFGLFDFCDVSPDILQRGSGHFVTFVGAKRKSSNNKDYLWIANPRGSSEKNDTDGFYGQRLGTFSYSIAGLKVMDKMGRIAEPSDEPDELHIIESSMKIYATHGLDCPNGKSLVMSGSGRGKCK